MKKKIIALAAAVMLTIPQVAMADMPIKVVVGGEKLKTDVAPIIIEGRTMLPVRAVFEAIGADVDYIAEERKVVAVKKDTTVEFVIDSNIMTINGEEKKLDVPAMIKDDRTLVPLRACAEAFDLDVEWNGETRTAKVKKEVSVVAESMSYDIIHKYTYDENGNCIYIEGSDGTWTKYEYDKNNNNIYEENLYSGWTKHTYDTYGNIILTEYDDGTTLKYTYDENGNNIYWENSSDFSCKIEYDEKGRKIFQEISEGNPATIRISRFTYDEKGRKVYYETSTGTKTKYEYDKNDNLIYETAVNGAWTKYTYDENNNLIYQESSNGTWIKYEYDKNGNRTYYETDGGKWAKSEYDENSNQTYYRNSDGNYTKYIVITR